MDVVDVVGRIEHVHERLAAAPDLRPGAAVDGLFAELVALVLDTPVAEAGVVLDDPVVQKLLPRLPTLAEGGLDLVWEGWFALYASPRDSSTLIISSMPSTYCVARGSKSGIWLPRAAVTSRSPTKEGRGGNESFCG